MVTLFAGLMIVLSLLVFRQARRATRRRDPFAKRPGRPDGVRTVYKRHS